MTAERSPRRAGRFVPSLLPWLLAAVMLVVYLLTLNHRVSLGNWRQVIELSGWNWVPNIYAPLTWLLTYPIRWLPASEIPLAANLFNAVCAALTLALLARSVALLPHDRTNDQRQRELSEFSLLTIPAAWLPPVFAVLVCGLQLTFWEHAIEASGEMLDLLIFAYLVRCLLEYRLLEQESWLTRFTFVYGLGVANNWALAAFFPCFLTAIIWLKGLKFFNAPFLLRSLLCGLAGLLLLLLLPLVVSLERPQPLGFWQGLHAVLAVYKGWLFYSPVPRSVLLVLSLTSILPIFVIGIRWGASFGDTSPIGVFLAKGMLHLVHGLFLVTCVWVALDVPFSPRRLEPRLAFLPFYFLGSLAIGYFSGYFLLIGRARNRKTHVEPNPAVELAGRVVVLGVWLLLIAAPVLLVFRNLPHVREISHDPFQTYAAHWEGSLPAKGAVVLSDDPVRLNFLQTELLRQGKTRENLLIDTAALRLFPAYLLFLDRKHPEFKLSAIYGNQAAKIQLPLAQMQLLKVLSRNHDVYYLHPSFGYFFEGFYLEPRGPVYQLHPYGTNQLSPPRLNDGQIAANKSFWQETADREFPALIRAATKPKPPASPNLFQKFLAQAHLEPEVSSRALLTAADYSRALDYWGVQLQHNDDFDSAARGFTQALDLNPDNFPARVNLDFNHDFRAGKKAVVEPVAHLQDRFGNGRTWDQVLGGGGPFDEPNYCFALGLGLMQTGFGRQAVEAFGRTLALAPDYPSANSFLAELHVAAHDYSNALVFADHALKSQPDDQAALFYKGTALLQMKSYEAAITPLTRFLNLQTNNTPLLTVGRLNRAIANLEAGHLDAARGDYQTVAKTDARYFQAYYGLGEIAWRRNDTAEAMRNYQLYITHVTSLTNAVINTNELEEVRSRYAKLKSGQP